MGLSREQVAAWLVSAVVAGAAPGCGTGPHPVRQATVVRSQPRAANPGDGRAVDRVLGYTSYVAVGRRRRREVALTFDDGPGAQTSAILRILGRAHAAATFFVIGRAVRARPHVVAAELAGGFEVGDHTETHPLMSSLSRVAQATEIDAAAAAMRRAGIPPPRLFRPPYGAFDRRTVGLLRARRMLMVLWSADTRDYRRPGVGRIVHTAVSGGRPGEIVLMHDGGGDRRQTVAALPRIIRRLRARGFRLVTVSRLIADDPPPRGQPLPQSLSGRR